MKKISLGGERVDLCPTCHGLWFDAGELQRMVNIVNIMSQIKLDEEDIDTIPETERERHLKCPDEGIRLDERDVGRGFIIDVCPSCGGLWLDDGELAAIKLVEQHVERNVRLYERLGK